MSKLRMSEAEYEALKARLEARGVRQQGNVYHLSPPEQEPFGRASKAGSPPIRSSGGKRADLGGLYLRSVWEANIARYLNWLQANGQVVRWEYEPDCYEFHTVKKGNRFYTPDFKVWEVPTRYVYWEVKGWMNDQSKTKLKRMAQFYPAEKVILIGPVQYATIKAQMRNVVPGWE